VSKLLTGSQIHCNINSNHVNDIMSNNANININIAINYNNLLTNQRRKGKGKA